MKIRFLLFLVLTWISGCLRLQAQNVSIIPCPREMKTGQQFFTIRPDVIIVYSTSGKNTALILQTYLKRLSGFQPELIESEKSGDGMIQFKYDKSFSKEQYDLIVAKEGIQIVASDNTGWFYGLQSLLQLLPSFVDSSDNSSSMNIPEVTIRDAPRFPWRAFLLDEARYFKGMDQVKMLLGEMALLKLNVFHWHLVDDQGWRIEIKKYPLLTEIGSKRKSSQIGPLKWQSPIQSAEPHEGFYTQEEIREIVNYAKERHITIVPEIEMPGHSTAAIASYSWLGDVALATHAASNGYDIVNSLHTETYLDYDYNSIPLSRAYAFNPIPAGLDPKYHDKVIGLGCQMWGEWISTRGNMHFMVFPRIAAYAEVGWTVMKNKNFDNFKLALLKFKKHWEQAGIYYAVDSVVEGESKR
jgi:N-acetyl-beta-hexosaminidase